MRSIRNRERPRLAGPEPDPSGPAGPSRLDFVFCQARLAFASVVAYSRFNSTLLLLQGAESIGAYAWRFDDGLPLFTELPRRLILGNSEGIKRAGAVRPRPFFSLGWRNHYLIKRCCTIP